jgi:hypothetical protein
VEVIVCKKFSSWRRLLRVTAYVRRFVQNLQALRKMSRMKDNPDVRIQLELGPLSTNELEKSEAYWIKEAQTSLHDRVKSGQLRQLSPFTDEDGIVRVGGRVDQALVSYDTKHPVLLPRNHWISHLITQHSHGIGHTGVATTVAKIRKKYWILRGHEFYTCLMEIANLINQRPICLIPNDPNDGSYLCPNDLLLGRASSTVPQGPFRKTSNPRHRVEFVQKIVDAFWKRWK